MSSDSNRRYSTTSSRTDGLSNGPSRRLSMNNNNNSSTSNDSSRLSLGISHSGTRKIDGRKSIGGVATNRRSSTGPANSRRSSMGVQQPSSSAPSKDPRPLRDRGFQMETIKNLIAFLAKSSYPYPLSQKLLVAPSARDFQSIFKFIYSQIDPTYEWSKKFEEEVLPVMKALRYPWAHELSKSQLYAVGSMHAWPGLLGMLGWMVDLVNCCDILDSATSTSFNNNNNTAYSTSEATNERLFYQYLIESYKLFLEGSDNFDSLLSVLEEGIEGRNYKVKEEIKKLSSKLPSAEEELQSLMAAESPLSKARREQEIYCSDIEKFEKFISHLHQKKSKFTESLANNRKELEDLQASILRMEQERSSLSKQVDAQDVSPEDIDRMNGEVEALVRQMELIKEGKEEGGKVFWERELQVQKKMDSVEALIHEYNSLVPLQSSFGREDDSFQPPDLMDGFGVGISGVGGNVNNNDINSNNNNNNNQSLLPPTPSRSQRQNMSLLRGLEGGLNLNPNATRAGQLVELDLSSKVNPILQRCRTVIHSQIHSSQDNLITLKERLDSLKDESQERMCSLVSLEKRIERLLVSYGEEKRAVMEENNRADTEIDCLSENIRQGKSEAAGQLLWSQQRLQRSSLEWERELSNIQGERDSLSSNLYSVLEDFINFKSNVESCLEELEVGFNGEAIMQ